MAVSVAEYLGQRTDIDGDIIMPVQGQSGALCPFMDRPCDKVNKSKPNHPVCSVRRPDSTIWITCEHRLCSTRQVKTVAAPTVEKPTHKEKVHIGLVPHQINILRQVAEFVYSNDFTDDDIVIRREASIPLGDGSSYHADYIMRNIGNNTETDRILLEMQGGGETSSTGKITRHLDGWKNNADRTNDILRQSVGAGTIVTNAWRRQQEQFLVKGNVVSQTGGKIVFAVGTMLFDYLNNRFANANLNDLRDHHWTLCLIAFKEDADGERTTGPIPLIVDSERLLYTNYSTFVRFLTDQGGPAPQIFEGDFLSLSGNEIEIG